VRVVDLGLRPPHAEQLRLIRLHGPPHSLSDRQRQALTNDEAAWFATGETAELAALRPARLMRAVFQGFAIANRPGDGGADGGGFFIWGSGDSAEIYAADSFG
jgi:hypothetical protein